MIDDLEYIGRGDVAVIIAVLMGLGIFFIFYVLLREGTI
jgi:hypothetical protein